MAVSNYRSPGPGRVAAITGGLGLLALLAAGPGSAKRPSAHRKADSAPAVQPLLQKYCLACHSAKVKKGGLTLERFTSLEQVRKDLGRWEQVIEMLEAGEMPPKKKPQPTRRERQQIIAW